MCLIETDETTERDSLLKLSLDNVREDLELTVSVRSEAGRRLNAVFVDDAQGPEFLVFAIHVTVEVKTSVNSDLFAQGCAYSPREGECMERLEPAVISLTALLAGTGDNLHYHLVGLRSDRCGEAGNMRNP